MKASRFALPLVMALALTAGSATVFAASPNSDQPHAGMPMNGSSNMSMNGMMGGYGMPMNGNPNMPMNGMMGGYGMPMNGNPNMPMGGMMGGMNGGFRGMLSPEGQGRFDKIMSDYRPRMDQLRGQLFVKNAELCALWRAATPDVKAVSSAAGEVSKLDAQFRSLTDELQKTLEKDVYAPERKAWEEKMKALAPNPQTPRK